LTPDDLKAIREAIRADYDAGLVCDDLGELHLMHAAMAGRCNSLVRQLETMQAAVDAVEQRFAGMAVEVTRKAVLADREVTAAQLRRQGITVEFAPWGGP